MEFIILRQVSSQIDHLQCRSCQINNRWLYPVSDDISQIGLKNAIVWSQLRKNYRSKYHHYHFPQLSLLFLQRLRPIKCSEIPWGCHIQPKVKHRYWIFPIKFRADRKQQTHKNKLVPVYSSVKKDRTDSILFEVLYYKLAG